MKFHIVDVFAERKYSGNQLAVVRDCEHLSDDEMQQITREFNFSETTFVLSEEPVDGGYPVRIFTPQSEVPFAGHPTLGTAAVIQKEIEPHADRVVLNLQVGAIAVTFDAEDGSNGGILWMRQAPPKFGSSPSREILAQVLGLDGADFHADYLPEEVSTGLPTLVVPLASLDAVRRAEVELESYNRLLDSIEAKLLLIYARETYSQDNDLNVRVFAHHFGVPEDPATGSANGCLAAYLGKHAANGAQQVEARVEQGCEIGRPSLLLLKAGIASSQIEVDVGGSVIFIAQGEFS